jgi:hypothetical protein
MAVHPRIGCFVYNDSTFWSMLGHGVTTGAAEFGAEVEVLSARDADGQDIILAQLIGQHVDALVLGVSILSAERTARVLRSRREPESRQLVPRRLTHD